MSLVTVFLSVLFFNEVAKSFWLYIRCRIMFTVFLRGKFVKRDLTSNETNLNWSLNMFCGMSLIWETASKLSFLLNSFVVMGLRSLVRYLATGWCAVPVVSLMGRNGGRWSKALWILGRSCPRADFIDVAPHVCIFVIRNFSAVMIIRRYIVLKWRELW